MAKSHTRQKIRKIVRLVEHNETKGKYWCYTLSFIIDADVIVAAVVADYYRCFFLFVGTVVIVIALFMVFLSIFETVSSTVVGTSDQCAK